MGVMEAKIVHVGINRNWRDVYQFASKPENMPLWASGLGAVWSPRARIGWHTARLATSA
jgi:hypothetical protein